jgi:hypothetical protein
MADARMFGKVFDLAAQTQNGRDEPGHFEFHYCRSERLLLLRPDPLHAGDLQWGLAALFGDLAVLLGDGSFGRLVAVEAAEQLRGDAAVRALRAVHISDVEKGEFAFGIGTGFLGHARLVGDADARVKANARRACMPSTTWQRRSPKRRSFRKCSYFVLDEFPARIIIRHVPPH